MQAIGRRILLAAVVWFPVVTCARADEPAGQGPLSVAEISRAHDSTWDSIYAIDMTYDVHTRYVAAGAVISDRIATGCRWHWYRGRYRLFTRDLAGDGQILDRLVDADTERRLSYPVSCDFATTPLSLCDERRVNATIAPLVAVDVDRRMPQNLQYLDFSGAAPRMRLSELFAAWKIELRQTATESSPRIAIRATFPDEGDQRYAGSHVDLELNVQKGFLIERAEIVEYGTIEVPENGDASPVRTSWQVLDWHESGTGLSYPSHVRYWYRGNAVAPKPDDGLSVEWMATDITLNALPEDESLGFTFPENAVVVETFKNPESVRIHVWGPENAPATDFHSAADFEAYRRKLCGNGAESVGAPPIDHDAASAVHGSRSVGVFRYLFAINLAGAAAILAFLWHRSRKGGA